MCGVACNVLLYLVSFMRLSTGKKKRWGQVQEEERGEAVEEEEENQDDSSW